MIDCYPDDNFAGMYGHKKLNDPAGVKSRTGYKIIMADCPGLWQPRLHNETAL